MSYKNLEIWKMAKDLSVDIHSMTVRGLPRFEAYETAPQIRRSCKSIRSNIVEGYGRRRYKQDFIKFLTYAYASCLETIDHLEDLFDNHSLTDESLYRDLHDRLDLLGAKLSRFTQSVESSHRSVKEEDGIYQFTSKAAEPEASDIRHPASVI